LRIAPVDPGKEIAHLRRRDRHSIACNRGPDIPILPKPVALSDEDAAKRCAFAEQLDRFNEEHGFEAQEEGPALEEYLRLEAELEALDERANAFASEEKVLAGAG
jgi:hypothetical protein